MDRQQPTVFKPGHWRFQCVMVVGPEFDGKMIWKLGYAGTTTGTSERMLQSNWNLVEGAPESVAARLRQGPARRLPQSCADVRLLGKTARKGEVSIDATRRRGTSSVRQRRRRGPATLGHSWSSGGSLSRGRDRDVLEPRLRPGPRPRSRRRGLYELELSATDSELSSTLRVVVTVSEPHRG